MKQFSSLYILLLVAMVFSCRKTVEDKQRNIIVEAVTNGVWYIEAFIEGTTDLTTEFAGYEFAFKENETVTATLGTNTFHGTWKADIPTYTITSNFPNATDPIKKLNGSFVITDSYLDYVEAERNTPTGKTILHLKKKL